MKKLSIILACFLVGLMSCTKSKEVHPELGDGNEEFITVAATTAHVEYTRTDIAELRKVVFHYCLSGAQQFAMAEMAKKEDFFDLTLNDLLSDTLYQYYYELFPSNGEASITEQKTFHTLAVDSPVPPTPPSGEHEWVDLGLPSGTLWATCNVGANSPEEFGHYFAWGETESKSLYSWETYKYCKNGGATAIIKYCDNPDYGYNGFTDNLTNLEDVDDAAVANWGNDWCMPTREQYQELLDNTTGTWTNVNGVHGMLFASNNGNSVFFPGAGGYMDNNVPEDDYGGWYWSSSLHQGDGAWCLEFWAGGQNCVVESYLRKIGYPVRPVQKNNNPTPPTPPSGAPEGAINGLFTINANGDQVYFSQGNLQYQASTNTWRFGENQWNYVGTQTPWIYDGGICGGNVEDSDNRDISESYDGWIDLFNWGTSGYSHGANHYQPWSIGGSISDYFAYGCYNCNLYDQTGQADWGYNAISNGGNTVNLWRTLRKEEWYHVVYVRSTNSGIRFVKGKVNGVNGLILLPDDWNSTIYELNNTNQTTVSYGCNVIDESVWRDVLQSNGAVFLPPGGGRQGYGTDVGATSVSAAYWSSTAVSSTKANSFHFAEDKMNLENNIEFWFGLSVRLVQDANR